VRIEVAAGVRDRQSLGQLVLLNPIGLKIGPSTTPEQAVE
jgi:hypothetical protein